MAAQATDMSLKGRLNRAIIDFSRQLATVKSGALVQVWMPEQCSDGTTVLSAQGLPFAVVGVGDLLALFRCVSVRYRFSTDVTRPSLMGAIGRVFATMEPEMSHDVQKYDKQVYLRVSEAQRCRVHSSLMVPIFERDHEDKTLAVFELVQSDKDVVFPAVVSWLSECLQGMSLSTISLEQMGCGPSGLRQWPMHVDHTIKSGTRAKGGSDGPTSQPKLQDMPSNGAQMEEGANMATSSGRMEATNDAPVNSGERGQGPLNRNSRESYVATSSGAHPSPTNNPQEGNSAGRPLALPEPPAVSQFARSSSQQGGQDGSGMQFTGSGSGGSGAATGAPGSPGQDMQLAQLMTFIQANGLNPNMLHSLRALVSGSTDSAAPTASTAVTSAPAASSLMPPPRAPAAVSMPTVGSSSQLQQALVQALAGNTGSGRLGSGNISVKPDPGDEEGEEGIGIGSDGDDDDDSDDEDGNGRANKNRVDGGAGKRLRFEELQAQFGLGLKEAAANLGICATTLKRACRRHGIKRWPRRQIVKLSKALTQMGYNGVPPPGLVQSAVTGQIATGAPGAGAEKANPAASVAASAAGAQPAATPPLTAAQRQQQLVALLATGSAPASAPPPPQQSQPAASGTAALHPLLAALGQQQQQQQQAQQPAQSMNQPASSMQGMSGQSNGLARQPSQTPPIPMQLNAMQQQHAGMMGQGGMGMMMMPMPNGMGMMPNGMGMMMAPAAMQQAFMQQAMAMGMMPGMMQHQQGADGSMPPPSMQPGSANSMQTSMQHGSMQQQPTHFMYGNGMMGGPAGGAMVPALVHELTRADGTANGAGAMQTSVSDMLGGGLSKAGFDMGMGCSSTLSIPTGELLHGLDAALLGGGDNNNHNGGLTSEAQMAAIHTLFMKDATGSLENFMEMLSDDLPVIQ